MPGHSENVRVRSILGRFLEHHRVWYFANAGDPDVWLSSADWMGRNLFKRIEVAFPVRDPELRQRIIDEGLLLYLADNRDAWALARRRHVEEGRATRPRAAALGADRTARAAARARREA